MASQCVVCHERDAESRCIECHKWVCDACAFKDHNGIFCSRECANNYSAFQETQVSDTSRGDGVISGLLRKIFALLALTLIAAGIYVYGAREGWFGGEQQSKVQEWTGEIKEEVQKGAEEGTEMWDKAGEKNEQ